MSAIERTLVRPAEARHRAEGPQEGLLHEVRRLDLTTELRSEAPADDSLESRSVKGGERIEGIAVTLLGARDEALDLEIVVHRFQA